jgi:hypothetical protein
MYNVKKKGTGFIFLGWWFCMLYVVVDKNGQKETKKNSKTE